MTVPWNVVLDFAGNGRLVLDFAKLTAVQMLDPGCEYTTLPTVTLTGSGSPGGATAGALQMYVASAIKVSGGGGYVVGDVLRVQGGTRPHVASAAVASGGSGYNANDELEVQGGTAATKARLRVKTVSGGAVTAVELINVGEYSALPSNPVSVTGAGSGATFNLTWSDAMLTVTAVSAGAVTAVAVTQGGWYTSLPGNTVSVSSDTGVGSGATFDLRWGIGSVPVSASGSGYASALTVSFSGSGNARAVALGDALAINGPVVAPPKHIFSGDGNVRFGVFPSLTSSQRPDKTVSFVYPDWWGAQGIDDGQPPSAGTGDDTVAVQRAFDSGRPVLFARHYPVTQVTLQGSSLFVDFRNFQLVGKNPGGSPQLTSVLQLKCGSSRLLNVAVSANGQNYICGIHWYTSGLVSCAGSPSFQPEFNRIEGMYIYYAKIGLVIGALPGQSGSFMPQGGAMQPDGIAVDAPLSESYVGGFESNLCVRGVYMRQANGKVILVAPVVNAGKWVDPDSSCCAIEVAHPGSELAVHGGTVNNVVDATGNLVRLTGGNLHLVACVIETLAPAYLEGDSRLRLDKVLTFGINLTAAAFQVKDSATGALSIRDTRIVRSAGYYSGGSAPLVLAVDQLGGSASPNLGFWVDCESVELRDCRFLAVSSYIPLVKGVRIRNRDAWITSYPSPGITRSLSYRLHEGADRLLGVVDVPAAQVTAYPQTGAATSGGWTFATGSGSCSWGSDNSGASLPGGGSIEGLVFQALIRLTSAVPSASCSATSGLMAIQPQRPYMLKGWVKTGTSAGTLIIRALFYRFDGTAAASTASTDFVSLPESEFGSTWQQLLAWFVPPQDASNLKLFVYVDSGADIRFANLELV